MNENHRLIKDVSNALGFYMERTRREEGFDLSGILRPGYDLNQFKFNKLFGYSTGYDTTMKKILMPQLCLPKTFRPESEEIKLREKFYKDELKYHLRFNRNNRKLSRPQSQKNMRSRSVNEFMAQSKQSEPKKTKPKVPAGLLTIRSTHTPALTKREKLSMVNITSKIMSASSELCFQKEDILLMKSLADDKNSNMCYVRKSQSQSRKDEQEEYERRLLNRHRQYERQMLLKNTKKDDTDELDKAPSTHSKTTFDDSHHSSEEIQKNESNPEPISNTPIKERTSSMSKSNAAETKANKETDKLNQLKELKEITDGPEVKYRVVVKTGERLGSSTEATIKLRLFGSSGKSKAFKLKNSKTHKIPFRKGNTDVFDLEVFDIGSVKAVQVGHSEKSIEYSWFIDYIGVEDQSKNVVYTFETPDWFSTTSDDGRTSRILFKQNSTSLDSDTDSSSKSDNDSDSSVSSKSTASTVKSGLKSSRSMKSESKKSFVSTSSSSLHRSSTPHSDRRSPEYSHRDSEAASRSKAITSRSSRKMSTSSSVRDAEIASQKFEESPRLDYQSVQSVNTTKVNLSLFEAVEMNRLDVIKEKLQMSPLCINKTDVSGRTLLTKACEDGFEAIVKYLVGNSDDLISIDTPLGYYPVHVCAERDQLDCLMILYDYGASLQTKTNLGNTPLHLAAENGHLKTVKWLVEKDVSVTILNNSAETAYEVAKRNGHIEIANYLAEPSGIKTQITIDDYSKQAGSSKSHFSRPDEPSPVERSSSSRSKQSQKSSRHSHKSSRSSTSSSSSSTDNSDSEKGDRKKKAESSIRIASTDVKSLIDNASLNRSRSNSKRSSRSGSSSSTSSSSDHYKPVRSGSKNSKTKSNKKSPSLVSNSSVMQDSAAKTHSRHSSNSKERLSSARTSDSDSSVLSKDKNTKSILRKSSTSTLSSSRNKSITNKNKKNNNVNSSSDSSSDSEAARLKETKAKSMNGSMTSDKKASKRSPSTTSSSRRSIQNNEMLNHLREVNDGQYNSYRIVVKTIQCDCDDPVVAGIKISLCGSKGKSKQMRLINSKTNSSPFNKGKTDVFDVAHYDVGKIQAVNVGITEENIDFNWSIEYIGVEDITKNVVYTFETTERITSDNHRERIYPMKNTTSINQNSSETSDFTTTETD